MEFLLLLLFIIIIIIFGCFLKQIEWAVMNLLSGTPVLSFNRVKGEFWYF